MQAEQYDIVEAAGLDPEQFDVAGYAPEFGADNGDAHPAILIGTYRGNHAAIRAFSLDTAAQDAEEPRTFWQALALVSRAPSLVFNELTHQEQERLRAEKLTPAGHDKPVGQAAVIGLKEPLKVQTPEPPLQQPKVENIEVIGESEVDVAPADCGGAECIVLQGPDGVQEVHQPNSCPKSAEADRGL